MKILNISKISLSLALILSCGASFAQTGNTKDEPVNSPDRSNVVNDNWKPTFEPTGVYDKVNHMGNAYIKWQYIREADILWKKTVWREIDIREKANMAFRYQGDENTGGGMFIEILLDAVKSGKVAAYSAYDDRFTTKLSKEQILEQIAPKDDSIEVEDPVTGQKYWKVIKKDFKPETITKYRIKEEWIFDRNQGKMIVRIIGLAPVRDIYDENNQYRASTAMFWIYYPSPKFREILSNYEVFNPANEVYRYTWDEYFESRQFSSRITKVSNPLDQRFEDIFGTDARGKMEALYESQQNAQEIFNKEHDMWVY